MDGEQAELEQGAEEKLVHLEQEQSIGGRRQRRRRPFPGLVFEEAIQLAQAIQEHASGQKVRRLTLLESIDKPPDSSATRELITASGQYKLTKGSYHAQYLELTEFGAQATSPESNEREQAQARLKLAVESIPAFQSLYATFKGNRLPSKEVMQDHLREQGVDAAYVAEGVETFILNGHFTGYIKERSGADRVLSLDQVLESKDGEPSPRPPQKAFPTESSGPSSGPAVTQTLSDWDTVCFYLTPIGAEDSEQRKHSDLFLGSIIEPVLAQFNLNAVRADNIDKPGMITKQIIEHILKSRLVIADLSFHNPNVFYELALRHACRLPTVQVIRSCDPIPFDIDQFRTVQIDTASIYTFVPKLETYRMTIANHIRKALENPDFVDSPVSTYCPELRVSFSG